MKVTVILSLSKDLILFCHPERSEGSHPYPVIPALSRDPVHKAGIWFPHQVRDDTVS